LTSKPFWQLEGNANGGSCFGGKKDFVAASSALIPAQNASTFSTTGGGRMRTVGVGSIGACVTGASVGACVTGASVGAAVGDSFDEPTVGAGSASTGGLSLCAFTSKPQTRSSASSPDVDVSRTLTEKAFSGRLSPSSMA
jgi:hypothetical protein